MYEPFTAFEIVQGWLAQWVISIQDIAGTVLPLPGMKAKMNIIYTDYDGELALSLTTENGGITIVDNKLHIKAKTAQTALLKAEKAVAEVELIDSENEVIGLIRKDVIIEKGRIQ